MRTSSSKMGRLNTTLNEALAKKTIQAYELIYINIDGGIYISNAPYTVTISSNSQGVRDGSYIGVGQYLGFSEIREETKFTISEITATLSGIPAHDNNNDSILSELLSVDYVDKEVEIARAFFNKGSDNTKSIGEYLDSVLIFKGRISAPVIQDQPNETTTVAITASNNWIDYERTNGQVTNDNRQQALYTGDRGFQYSKDVVKDIKWQEG